MRFKVFYGDGTTATDETPPDLLPKTNVQVIMVEDPEHGRAFCRTDDFYIWTELDGSMSWTGCDIFGLWDYLQAPGEKVVLFGRTLGTQDYREVLGQAMNDDYLPEKTAWHRQERKP